MDRYQVYLDPQSVAVLDDFGEAINVSRSKILRSVVNHLAEEFAKLLAPTKKSSQHYRYFDKLVGCLSLRNKSKTNLVEAVDEVVYSQDNL